MQTQHYGNLNCLLLNLHINFTKESLPQPCEALPSELKNKS